MKNEKLASFSIRENGWTLYEYKDWDNGYLIQLIKPPYLKYEGSISICAIAEPVTDFFLTDFTVTPISSMGRIQQSFSLGLGGMWHGRSRAVDRHGQPLTQLSEDSGEAYERWLMIYEEHFEEIMELIAYFKDFFGEEALS
jgi:hypothetical protein